MEEKRALLLVVLKRAQRGKWVRAIREDKRGRGGQMK